MTIILKLDNSEGIHMTKEAMRKAIEEGMKLYFASGKAVTKCPEATMQVKTRNPRIKKDTVEIETQNLPTALKIRFGFKD